MHVVPCGPRAPLLRLLHELSLAVHPVQEDRIPPHVQRLRIVPPAPERPSQRGMRDLPHEPRIVMGVQPPVIDFVRLMSPGASQALRFVVQYLSHAAYRVREDRLQAQGVDELRSVPQGAREPLRQHVQDVPHPGQGVRERRVQAQRRAQLRNLSQGEAPRLSGLMRLLPHEARVFMGSHAPLLEVMRFLPLRPLQPLRHILRVVSQSEPRMVERHLQPSARPRAHLPQLPVRQVPSERVFIALLQLPPGRKAPK